MLVKLLKRLRPVVVSGQLKLMAPFVLGTLIIGASFALPTKASVHLDLSSHKATVTKKPTPVVTKPNPVKPVPEAVTPPVVATSKPVATKPTVKTKTVAAAVPAPGSSVKSLTPAPASQTSSGGSSGGSGNQNNNTSPPTPPPVYDSTNWSGYMATTGNYTAVSANWVVPTPTGNGASLTADASWVGIGGVSSNDLIQVGTEDVVEPGGQVFSAAFYEMLPASSQTISGINVSPGDSMSASLVETTTSQWIITITDNTSNQTFTNNVSYVSTNSSAEWIEEDPSTTGGRLIPFDNFGTVNFSDAATTVGGSVTSLVNTSPDEIILVNQSDQPIATPSSIGADGVSFSIAHD